MDRLFIRMTRMGPDVWVGPFATLDAIAAWCDEHHTNAAIIVPHPPDVSDAVLWGDQAVMTDAEYNPIGATT